MQKLVAIDLNENLEIEVHPCDSVTPVIKVKLNRINAQNLAHALLQYAGAEQRAFSLGSSCMFGAFDITHRPTKLVGPTTVKLRSGVVKLGR